MKTTLCTVSTLLLTAALAAQGSLTTATGYAVEARAGSLTTPANVQGVPAGTAIPNAGLHIQAVAGSPALLPLARASTHVRFSPLSTSANQRTVLVSEAGRAIPTPALIARAGTSDDHLQGGLAPHGLAWTVPAPLGATGVVAVTWTASASIGASQRAAVDVDGDGTPEFDWVVSHGNVQVAESFRVHAGANGFRIAIVTGARAGANVSVPTATGSHCDGQLSVSLRLDPFWSFHHFGAECGGRLRGVLPGPSGSQFALDLTDAAPHVPALLAIGPRMRTPVQLPGSHCLLHINPLVAVAQQTNAQGRAHWTFPLVSVMPVPTISFQVVTIDVNSLPILRSSNGATLIHH
jgi:hypothetical protein